MELMTEELERLFPQGPLGVGIERDLNFGFGHTLAEVMEKQI